MKKINYVFITLLIIFVFSSGLVAQEAPSSSDLNFAKSFAYNLINATYNESFTTKKAKIMIENPETDRATMKAFFQSLGSSQKQFYIKIKNLRPTAKFNKCYDITLDSTYLYLKYLKHMVDGIDSGADIKSVYNQNKNVLNESSVKFEQANKSFMEIVSKWPESHIYKVMTPDLIKKISDIKDLEQ